MNKYLNRYFGAMIDFSMVLFEESGRFGEVSLNTTTLSIILIMYGVFNFTDCISASDHLEQGSIKAAPV